jgi:hypothetical protein
VLVVSDDWKWCQEAFPDAVVVKPMGNSNTALLDMALLSACQYQVIANSSFSWWAAWLNAHPERMIVAPDRWMNDGSTPIETKFMRGLTTIAA